MPIDITKLNMPSSAIARYTGQINIYEATGVDSAPVQGTIDRTTYKNLKRRGLSTDFRGNPEMRLYNDQGGWELLGRGAWNTLVEIPSAIVEGAGLLGELIRMGGNELLKIADLNPLDRNEYDFDNYITDVSDWMRRAKGTVYRKDPSKIIDMSDPAFWSEAVPNLIGSIVPFFIGGAGIAKGLGIGAKGLAKATKMSAYGAKVLTKATTVPTALLTTYWESAMIGQEVYDRIMDETYKTDFVGSAVMDPAGKINSLVKRKNYLQDILKNGNEQGIITPEEYSDIQKEIVSVERELQHGLDHGFVRNRKDLAVQSAMESVKLNMLVGTAFNLTSSIALVKSMNAIPDETFYGGLRRLAKKEFAKPGYIGDNIDDLSSTRGRSKFTQVSDWMERNRLTYGSEGFQEGFEELGNEFSERRGLKKSGLFYTTDQNMFSSFLEASLSEKGLYAFAMGMLGGVAMKGMQNEIPFVKGKDGKRYSLHEIERQETEGAKKEYRNILNGIQTSATNFFEGYKNYQAAKTPQERRVAAKKWLDINAYDIVERGIAEGLQEHIAEISKSDEFISKEAINKINLLDEEYEKTLDQYNAEKDPVTKLAYKNSLTNIAQRRNELVSRLVPQLSGSKLFQLDLVRFGNHVQTLNTLISESRKFENPQQAYGLTVSLYNDFIKLFDGRLEHGFGLTDMSKTEYDNHVTKVNNQINHFRKLRSSLSKRDQASLDKKLEKVFSHIFYGNDESVLVDLLTDAPIQTEKNIYDVLKGKVDLDHFEQSELTLDEIKAQKPRGIRIEDYFKEVPPGTETDSTKSKTEKKENRVDGMPIPQREASPQGGVDTSGINAQGGVDTSGVNAQGGADTSGVNARGGADTSGVNAQGGVDTSGVNTQGGVNTQKTKVDPSIGTTNTESSKVSKKVKRNLSKKSFTRANEKSNNRTQVSNIDPDTQTIHEKLEVIFENVRPDDEEYTIDEYITILNDESTSEEDKNLINTYALVHLNYSYLYPKDNNNYIKFNSYRDLYFENKVLLFNNVTLYDNDTIIEINSFSDLEPYTDRISDFKVLKRPFYNKETSTVLKGEIVFIVERGNSNLKPLSDESRNTILSETKPSTSNATIIQSEKVEEKTFEDRFDKPELRVEEAPDDSNVVYSLAIQGEPTNDLRNPSVEDNFLETSLDLQVNPKAKEQVYPTNSSEKPKSVGLKTPSSVVAVLNIALKPGDGKEGFILVTHNEEGLIAFPDPNGKPSMVFAFSNKSDWQKMFNFTGSSGAKYSSTYDAINDGQSYIITKFPVVKKRESSNSYEVVSRGEIELTMAEDPIDLYDSDILGYGPNEISLGGGEIKNIFTIDVLENNPDLQPFLVAAYKNGGRASGNLVIVSNGNVEEYHAQVNIDGKEIISPLPQKTQRAIKSYFELNAGQEVKKRILEGKSVKLTFVYDTDIYRDGQTFMMKPYANDKTQVRTFSESFPNQAEDFEFVFNINNMIVLIDESKNEAFTVDAKGYPLQNGMAGLRDKTTGYIYPVKLPLLSDISFTTNDGKTISYSDYLGFIIDLYLRAVSTTENITSDESIQLWNELANDANFLKLNYSPETLANLNPDQKLAFSNIMSSKLRDAVLTLEYRPESVQNVAFNRFQSFAKNILRKTNNQPNLLFMVSKDTVYVINRNGAIDLRDLMGKPNEIRELIDNHPGIPLNINLSRFRNTEAQSNTMFILDSEYTYREILYITGETKYLAVQTPYGNVAHQGRFHVSLWENDVRVQVGMAPRALNPKPESVLPKVIESEKIESTEVNKVDTKIDSFLSELDGLEVGNFSLEDSNDKLLPIDRKPIDLTLFDLESLAKEDKLDFGTISDENLKSVIREESLAIQAAVESEISNEDIIGYVDDILDLLNTKLSGAYIENNPGTINKSEIRKLVEKADDSSYMRLFNLRSYLGHVIKNHSYYATNETSINLITDLIKQAHVNNDVETLTNIKKELLILKELAISKSLLEDALDELEVSYSLVSNSVAKADNISQAIEFGNKSETSESFIPESVIYTDYENTNVVLKDGSVIALNNLNATNSIVEGVELDLLFQKLRDAGITEIYLRYQPNIFYMAQSYKDLSSLLDYFYIHPDTFDLITSNVGATYPILEAFNRTNVKLTFSKSVVTRMSKPTNDEQVLIEGVSGAYKVKLDEIENFDSYELLAPGELRISIAGTEESQLKSAKSFVPKVDEISLEKEQEQEAIDNTLLENELVPVVNTSRYRYSSAVKGLLAIHEAEFIYYATAILTDIIQNNNLTKDQQFKLFSQTVIKHVKEGLHSAKGKLSEAEFEYIQESIKVILKREGARFPNLEHFFKVASAKLSRTIYKKTPDGIGEKLDIDPQLGREEGKYDQSPDEIKYDEVLSFRVKMLLTTIPEIDAKGNLLLNRLLLPKYVNYQLISNILLKQLSGKNYTFDEMVEIVEGLKDAIPYMKLLANRLRGLPMSSKIDFVVGMSVDENSPFGIYVREKGTNGELWEFNLTKPANESNEYDIINDLGYFLIKRFSTPSITGLYNFNNNLLKENLDNAIIAINFGKTNEEAFNAGINLLLGLSLTVGLTNSLLAELNTNRHFRYKLRVIASKDLNTKTYFKDILKSIAASIQTSATKSKYGFARSYPQFLIRNSPVLKFLASAMSDSGYSGSSNTFLIRTLNDGNKILSTKRYKSKLTLVLQKLKDKFPVKHTPFNRNSRVLAGEHFEVEPVSGVPMALSGVAAMNDFKNMNREDLYLFKLFAYLLNDHDSSVEDVPNTHKYVLGALSDKPHTFYFTISSEVDVTLIKESVLLNDISDEIVNIIFNRIVKSELLRMKHVREKGSGLKGYLHGSQMFYEIYALNSQVIMDSIVADQTSNKYNVDSGYISSKTKDLIFTIVKEYINNIVQENIDLYSTLELVSWDTPGSEFRTVLSTITTNSGDMFQMHPLLTTLVNNSLGVIDNLTFGQITQAFFYKMAIDSMLAQYEIHAAILKDVAIYSKAKKALNTESDRFANFESTLKNYNKRLAAFLASGAQAYNAKERRIQFVLRKSPEATNDSVVAYYEKLGINVNSLRNMKSDDGQSYRTAIMQAQLILAMGYGIKTDDSGKSLLNDDEINQLLTLKDSQGNDVPFNKLRELAYKLRYLGHPTKTVYTGDLETSEEVDGFIYEKSMGITLLPELTAGLLIDNTRKTLEELENATGIPVNMASAESIKLGMPELGDQNQKTQIQSLTGQYLQVSRTIKDEEEIHLMSQISKILQSFGKLNPAYQSKVDTLRKGLIFMYSYHSEVLKNTIVTTISTEEGDVEVLNVSYLNKNLRKQLALHDKPAYVESLITMDPNVGFKYPIHVMGNLSQELYTYLNSIAKDSLRPKIKGSYYKLISSYEFTLDPNGNFKGSKVIYTSNFNGKLEPAHFEDVDGNWVQPGTPNAIFKPTQALVGHMLQDVFGETIDLFEKDNFGEYRYITEAENGQLFLKDNVFDANILTVFGARIPTSLSSMAGPIEIVGIIPYDLYGNVMIMNDEARVRKSADFDGDTEFVLLPEIAINPDGKIERVKFTKEQRRHMMLKDYLSYNKDYESKLKLLQKYQSEVKEKSKLVKDTIRRINFLNSIFAKYKLNPSLITLEKFELYSNKYNELQAILDETKAEIDDIVREYIIPLTEDIASLEEGALSTLPSEMFEKSLSENHNDLLDTFLSIYSLNDKEAQKMFLNPIDYGLIAYDDARDPKYDEYGGMLGFINSIYPNAISTLGFSNDNIQLRLQAEAKEAESAIGVFASTGVTAQQILGFNLIVETLFGFKILENGKNLRNEFGNDLTEVSSNEFIVNNIANLLHAALDNVNLGNPLGRLNVNDHTYNMATGYLLAGGNFENMLLLLNLPVVRDYIQNYAYKKDYHEKKRIKAEYYKRDRKIPFKVDTSRIITELENYRSGKPIDVAYQTELLYMLFQLEQVSSEFLNKSAILNKDSKPLSSNNIELLQLINKYQDQLQISGEVLQTIPSVQTLINLEKHITGQMYPFYKIYKMSFSKIIRQMKHSANYNVLALSMGSWFYAQMRGISSTSERLQEFFPEGSDNDETGIFDFPSYVRALLTPQKGQDLSSDFAEVLNMLTLNPFMRDIKVSGVGQTRQMGLNIYKFDRDMSRFWRAGMLELLDNRDLQLPDFNDTPMTIGSFLEMFTDYLFLTQSPVQSNTRAFIPKELLETLGITEEAHEELMNGLREADSEKIGFDILWNRSEEFQSTPDWKFFKPGYFINSTLLEKNWHWLFENYTDNTYYDSMYVKLSVVDGFITEPTIEKVSVSSRNGRSKEYIVIAVPTVSDSKVAIATLPLNTEGFNDFGTRLYENIINSLHNMGVKATTESGAIHSEIATVEDFRSNTLISRLEFDPSTTYTTIDTVDDFIDRIVSPLNTPESDLKAAVIKNINKSTNSLTFKQYALLLKPLFQGVNPFQNLSKTLEDEIFEKQTLSNEKDLENLLESLFNLYLSKSAKQSDVLSLVEQQNRALDNLKDSVAAVDFNFVKELLSKNNLLNLTLSKNISPLNYISYLLTQYYLNPDKLAKVANAVQMLKRFGRIDVIEAARGIFEGMPYNAVWLQELNALNRIINNTYQLNYGRVVKGELAEFISLLDDTGSSGEVDMIQPGGIAYVKYKASPTGRKAVTKTIFSRLVDFGQVEGIDVQKVNGVQHIYAIYVLNDEEIYLNLGTYDPISNSIIYNDLGAFLVTVHYNSFNELTTSIPLLIKNKYGEAKTTGAYLKQKLLLESDTQSFDIVSTLEELMLIEKDPNVKKYLQLLYTFFTTKVENLERPANIDEALTRQNKSPLLNISGIDVKFGNSNSYLPSSKTIIIRQDAPENKVVNIFLEELTHYVMFETLGFSGQAAMEVLYNQTKQEYSKYLSEGGEVIEGMDYALSNIDEFIGKMLVKAHMGENTLFQFLLTIEPDVTFNENSNVNNMVVDTLTKVYKDVDKSVGLTFLNLMYNHLLSTPEKENNALFVREALADYALENNTGGSDVLGLSYQNLRPYFVESDQMYYLQDPIVVKEATNQLLRQGVVKIKALSESNAFELVLSDIFEGAETQLSLGTIREKVTYTPNDRMGGYIPNDNLRANAISLNLVEGVSKLAPLFMNRINESLISKFGKVRYTRNAYNDYLAKVGRYDYDTTLDAYILNNNPFGRKTKERDVILLSYPEYANNIDELRKNNCI